MNAAFEGFRDRFVVPVDDAGNEKAYLCGNSLGLLPRSARERVVGELDDWGRLAVDGHFRDEAGWYRYHETLRDGLASIVGAHPDEVVAMNGLTVNLHLLMVSFYRPTAKRFKILVEDRSFPSDTYAVRSQARFHGFDPDEAIVVAPRDAGSDLTSTERFLEVLDREGGSVALVFVPGVHYFTGEVFDLETIARAARAHGCVVGTDLAHAAGNVPLRLHDWGVDFAAWCSYKYLNAGPGAIAGAFVHRRHGRSIGLPRFAGWWGNDPDTRFRMHLEPEFVPVAGADGWQLSNPPVLAMAPLGASLELFSEAGIERLRARSLALTGRLIERLDAVPGGRFEIVTPREASCRGCQVSIRVSGGRAREAFERLERAGVVGDFREPDVIRVAPVPLYNTTEDVDRFAEAFASAVGDR